MIGDDCRGAEIADDQCVHRTVAQRRGDIGQALDREPDAVPGGVSLRRIGDDGLAAPRELLGHLAVDLVGIGPRGPAAALQLHRLGGDPLG